MSIISCPECGKKISSVAPICPHCGFQGGEISEEQMLVFLKRGAREKVYRITMASYAVITVFLAGFAWYWGASASFQQPSTAGPFVLMGVGALGYLLVRIMLFQARRRQKELKRRGDRTY